MRKWLWITGSIVLLLGLSLVIAFNWSGTGFHGKTLWEWLNLLGVLAVPIVVGFGAVWYTVRQTKASETAAEQQRKTEQERAEQQHKSEIEVAEQRHKTELEIATDNQREAALQVE